MSDIRPNIRVICFTNKDFACNCHGLGDKAVEMQQVNPSGSVPAWRWFITIGHAGYNSEANQRSGYESSEAARRDIRAHEARIVKVKA